MAFKDYFFRDGIPNDARKDQWVYVQDRAQTGLTATSDVFGFSLMHGTLKKSLSDAGVFGDQVKVFPWWLSDAVLQVDAPPGATVKAAAYFTGEGVVVFVSNHDRDKEHEVALQLKRRPLWKLEGPVTWQDLTPEDKGTLIWTDIDPGITPPEKVMAARGELPSVTDAAGQTALDDEGEMSKDEMDLAVSETSPKEEGLKRLAIRIEGSKVRLVVRPHDYRILRATIK